MGEQLDQVSVGTTAAFGERLRRNLFALRRLLERPNFGVGETTIGAELEIALIADSGQPAMVNRDVLEALAEHRMTFELDRFNLEFNADPLPLAGQPFSALGGEFAAALARIDDAAAAFGARSMTIGTPPTLELDVLAEPETMTDLPRYRALELALRGFRRRPFELNIAGEDRLVARCEGVTIEGANTSLQLHLRVSPEEFADTYNAAQLATPIALSLAGNSPLFCGHRLWEETRIAVFKQAVDIRGDHHENRRPPRVCFGHGWVRRGIHELFAETVHLHETLLPREFEEDDPVAAVERGEVPSLRELRLHLGTVWRWNRPVFDPHGEGHLRVELRALPAGPTVVDMMANAAFYLGLTLGLRDRIGDLLPAVPFEATRSSFYRAAQHGLDATLAWPATSPPSPSYIAASELAPRLLPLARHGLVGAGVEATEADRYLATIAGRAKSGQTGARWQRAALAKLMGAGMEKRAALARLTLAYIENASTNAPVHTWSLP